MNNNTDLNTLFGDIADSIRGKEETQDSIKPENFASKITSLPSGLSFNHFYFGTDEPDASKYKYWVNGDIPNKTPLAFVTQVTANNTLNDISSSENATVTKLPGLGTTGNQYTRFGNYYIQTYNTTGSGTFTFYQVDEDEGELKFNGTSIGTRYISLPGLKTTDGAVCYYGGSKYDNYIYFIYKTGTQQYKVSKYNIETDTIDYSFSGMSFGGSYDLSGNFVKVRNKNIYYYVCRLNEKYCIEKIIDNGDGTGTATQIYTNGQNKNIYLAYASENAVVFNEYNSNKLYVLNTNTLQVTEYSISDVFNADNTITPNIAYSIDSSRIFFDCDEVYFRTDYTTTDGLNNCGKAIYRLKLNESTIVPYTELIMKTGTLGNSTNNFYNKTIVSYNTITGHLKLTSGNTTTIDGTSYNHDSSINNIVLDLVSPNENLIGLPTFTYSSGVLPDVRNVLLVPSLKHSTNTSTYFSRYLLKLYLQGDNEYLYSFVALGNTTSSLVPEVYYNGIKYTLKVSNGTLWHSKVTTSNSDVIYYRSSNY